MKNITLILSATCFIFCFGRLQAVRKLNCSSMIQYGDGSELEKTFHQLFDLADELERTRKDKEYRIEKRIEFIEFLQTEAYSRLIQMIPPDWLVIYHELRKQLREPECFFTHSREAQRIAFLKIMEPRLRVLREKRKKLQEGFSSKL